MSTSISEKETKKVKSKFTDEFENRDPRLKQCI